MGLEQLQREVEELSAAIREKERNLVKLEGQLRTQQDIGWIVFGTMLVLLFVGLGIAIGRSIP